MSASRDPNVPEPDRYSVEYVDLAGFSGDFVARLQEVLNEGTRHSWKLTSVVQDPSGEGVIVVWDLEGFISG
jgi:hypothetical protein